MHRPLSLHLAQVKRGEKSLPAGPSSPELVAGGTQGRGGEKRVRTSARPNYLIGGGGKKKEEKGGFCRSLHRGVERGERKLTFAAWKTGAHLLGKGGERSAEPVSS